MERLFARTAAGWPLSASFARRMRAALTFSMLTPPKNNFGSRKGSTREGASVVGAFFLFRRAMLRARRSARWRSSVARRWATRSDQYRLVCGVTRFPVVYVRRTLCVGVR